jgi:phosphatidylethanolamine/phosphatidyl-N-methylethanolamine N-methyltransferase
MHQEDQAWSDYRRSFSDVYDESNYESPLQAAVMRASHRLVERSLDAQASYGTVLEIGAGTGEHLSFVRHAFETYILSDGDPATLEVARRKTQSDARADKLKFELQDGSTLSHADASIDRIVAVHVLEHIYQPHLAVKEWRRVLRPGGLLSILIPTDPGIAWRLGRHLGPRRNALRRGIAYDYVMAREHVNSCNNLVAILRHYFPDRHEAWWPLPIPSIDLNLFFAFSAVEIKR